MSFFFNIKNKRNLNLVTAHLWHTQKKLPITFFPKGGLARRILPEKQQLRRGGGCGEGGVQDFLEFAVEHDFLQRFDGPFFGFGKGIKGSSVEYYVGGGGKPNLVDFFPILGKFDPQGIRRRMTVHFGKVIDLLSGLIDERIERGKSDQNADVIDVLLAACKENPEDIDRTHIERMCLDLFAAGTDTSSSTVEWAMAEALENPDITKKAKAELDEVVGKGKVLEEADISRLPYLRCMVKETLRLHPPVPFLIPRRMEEDVDVCGYTVPKNSQVLVNAWAIGRDAGIWENPLEFKPERFIGSEVDLKGRDFELIPFGGGRRICPGLPLAVRMVSVMVGSLLNSFDWKIEEEIDMEEKFGITLHKARPLLAVPIPL
ncbi:hypothetical protein ACP275_08G045200 [Erythranthe tilingii]